MAETQRGFGGHPADRATLELIEAGDLSFAIEYRHVGAEEGPSVHVFGPVEGVDEEILRFDCFDKVPHYHYGFSYIDQPMVPIDTAAVGDPLEWVCERIERHLPDMLTKAGAGDLAAGCDASRLGAIASELRERAQGLSTEV